MIRKITLGFLSVLLGLVLALVIGAGLLSWRLAQGPMDLNYLVPVVQDHLSSSFHGVAKAQIGGLVLSWDSPRSYPILSASAVTLQNNKDERIASVSQMDVGVAFTPLLIGQLRFHTLNLTSPTLTAYVTKDGDISFIPLKDQATPAPMTGKTSASDWQKHQKSWLSFFHSLKATDMHVTLVDEISNQNVNIVMPILEAVRNRKGLDAKLQVFFSSDDSDTEASTSLQGTAHYDAKAQATTGTLNFQNTRLDELSLAFAPFVRTLGSDLAILQKFSIPLNGTLDVSFDRKLSLQNASLHLRGDAGQISLPDYYDAPLNVQNILLNADYDGIKHNGTLHDFYGEIKDPGHDAIPFSMTGTVLKDQALTFNLSLDHISSEHLKQYWPKTVAQGAYNWVSENVRTADITKAWLGITANLGNQKLTLTNVEGMFDVDHADVHYFGDYPIVQSTKGSVSFNENSFNISVLSAEVRDIKITDSTLIITGLDADNQDIDINATMRGPVKTTLQILDTAPYKFASSFGLNPQGSDGNAAIRLRFGFPLIKALKTEDLRFSGAGNFNSVALLNIVAKQNLSNANIALTLDGDGVGVKGTGTLGTAPADFEWKENFAGASPRTAVDFKTSIDNTMRKMLDLPGDSLLTGPILATGTYTADDKKSATLALNLNLQPTIIALNDLNYTKPAGSPATAKVTVLMKDNKPAGLKNIIIDGPDLHLRGDATFDSGSSVPSQLNLSPLQIGATNATLNITTPKQGNRTIVFKGPRFDAMGLLSAPTGQKTKPEAPKKNESDMFAGLDIALDLGFDQITLPHNQTLSNAGGGMHYNGTMWSFFDLSAALSPSGRLKMLWQPDASGQQRLDINSDNAGAVLAGLGLSQSIHDGTLSIIGQGNGKLEPWIAEGTASITDFKVMDAPALARLIALTSPGGLIDTLSGEGLSFSRLKTDYQFGAKQIVLKEGRMSGPSIGLSFGGKIDRENNVLDLKGTIVPLYAINSFLGNIPLIGDLFVGTQGDGIFSATYTIDGPTSDPNVSVNPLSAFAPGFLRRLLFEGE